MKNAIDSSGYAIHQSIIRTKNVCQFYLSPATCFSFKSQSLFRLQLHTQRFGHTVCRNDDMQSSHFSHVVGYASVCSPSVQSDCRIKCTTTNTTKIANVPRIQYEPERPKCKYVLCVSSRGNWKQIIMKVSHTQILQLGSVKAGGMVTECCVFCVVVVVIYYTQWRSVLHVCMSLQAFYVFLENIYPFSAEAKTQY